MVSKKIVIFDLDGTLTESKASMDAEMAELLTALLEKKAVAVISGCRFAQFEDQFLRMLSPDATLGNLFLFPTCGAAFHKYADGVWTEVYANTLSPRDKRRIYNAFDSALSLFGHAPKEVWGEIIEDRGSQITFSALGQNAPLEAKRAWDPNQKKRERIISLLRQELDDFDVKYGGTTSIDITHKGIDKEYGINKIREHLGHALQEMVFVGDRLEPGGNDHAVLATGIDCFSVADPVETKDLLRVMLCGHVCPSQ